MSLPQNPGRAKLGLVVVVVYQSKSPQKVEKLLKVKNYQKSKKLQKLPVWTNVYQSTNLLSVRYKELEFPHVFELFLLSSEGSF